MREIDGRCRRVLFVMTGSKNVNKCLASTPSTYTKNVSKHSILNAKTNIWAENLPLIPISRLYIANFLVDEIKEEKASFESRSKQSILPSDKVKKWKNLVI